MSTGDEKAYKGADCLTDQHRIMTHSGLVVDAFNLW